MRYLVLLLLAGCLTGPSIIDSSDDGVGTAWFKGRAGYGYVTAEVMEERRLAAEALISKHCADAGFVIRRRHLEDGVTRDNYIDFACGAGVDAGQ